MRIAMTVWILMLVVSTSNGRRRTLCSRHMLRHRNMHNIRHISNIRSVCQVYNVRQIRSMLRLVKRNQRQKVETFFVDALEPVNASTSATVKASIIIVIVLHPHAAIVQRCAVVNAV